MCGCGCVGRHEGRRSDAKALQNLRVGAWNGMSVKSKNNAHYLQISGIMGSQKRQPIWIRQGKHGNTTYSFKNYNEHL